MADRVSASLKVGGALAKAALPEFVQLIVEQNVGPCWDEYFDGETDIAAHLAAGSAGVTFYAHQVAGGEFTDLQAFCVDHGLTYVLTYDGFCGCTPGRRIRRPEDTGDGLTCTLEEDQGAACLSAAQTRALGFTSIDAITAHLARFDHSVTPPFVLTEGPAA